MNTTKAIFTGCETFVIAAPALYQYDYGQVLQIEGLELPTAYQVEFSNSAERGETVAAIGDEGGVEIPNELLQTGKNIYAFLFLHNAETDGETEYKITIYVTPRPSRPDDTPTPEQESAIDAAIAALNDAVERAAASADAAENSDASAAQSAADAQTAASAAQGAAEAAGTAKEAAGASASDASDSAAAAGRSATAAAQSESGAAYLNSLAEGHEREAKFASGAAEDARYYAEIFSNAADRYQRQANEAKTEAQSSAAAAAASAQAASGAVAAVQQSTETASAAAQSAGESATAAEASAAAAAASEAEVQRIEAKLEPVEDLPEQYEALESRVDALEAEFGAEPIPVNPTWERGGYTENGYVGGNTSVYKRSAKLPPGKYTAVVNADYVYYARRYVSDSKGVTLAQTVDGSVVSFESDGEIILTIRRADSANIVAMTAAEINAVWQLTREPLAVAVAEKQDKLTFDTIPTAGSANPVTSGGVAAAVAEIDGEVSDLKSSIDAVEALPIISPPDVETLVQDGEYTDEAKIALQKALGIYEAPWELIREDTFTNAEEADHIITTDADGQPLELTDVKLFFYLPRQSTPSAQGSSGGVWFTPNGLTGTRIMLEAGAMATATDVADRGWYAILVQQDGYFDSFVTAPAVSSNSGTMRWRMRIPAVNGSYIQGGCFLTGPFLEHFGRSEKKVLITEIIIKAVTGMGKYILYGRRKVN